MKQPAFRGKRWRLGLCGWLALTAFAAGAGPRLVIMTVEDPDNYQAARTMPEFAETELRPRGYEVTLVPGDRPAPHHFEGLEDALQDADGLVVFVRRRTLPKAQLDAVRAHVAAGKPLIGIRTANHAFVLRGGAPVADPALDVWPAFAPDVLGGHNVGYHRPDARVTVTVDPVAATHPIARGIDPATLAAHGSLYQVRPLAAAARPLFWGQVAGFPAEPVAWTHHYDEARGRVFYTSLGHEDDFPHAPFHRLLLQGIHWALEGEIPLLRGLSRSDLLESRAADGALRHAATVEEWEPRRREAVEGFLRITGVPPEVATPAPLDLQIEEEADAGRYVRRRITYAAADGSRVPAYLCVPKAALEGRPAPAVLCLHPTDDRVGCGVVVGLGGKENRAYAAELAERGFVTLAPGYPHLAGYQPDFAAQGFASGTMKAVADNRRGLDLLASLPFVNARPGFAAIGHSLGGHNSIFTSVMDERIKAVVTSCGFDSFLDYKNGDLRGWTQDRYMAGLRPFVGRPADVPFDFYELLAALAPRPVFINASRGDDNFQWRSVRRIEMAARAVYRLHGVPERLRVHYPEAGHDFPKEQRVAAYALIEEVLGRP